MSKDKPKKTKQEDISFGIGLSTAFILLAVFIYMRPEYLGGSTVSIIISAILIVIGVLGLGIEINKLNGKENLGFDNLGIGLGLLFLWGILHYYFSYVWVNWVILTILMFALIGIMSGISSLVIQLANIKSPKQLIARIPIIITQLSVTVVAIYKILKGIGLV